MTKLHVLDAEPLGEGIVDRLKYALKKAKRGEISSLAIAWVERDGSSDSRWSDAPSLSALIGSIERMKHEMLIKHDG